MFSCSVHLPDADLCIANAPGQHLGCFNLKNDYEYVGPDIVLKAGAVKHYKPMTTIQDVSKFTCLDPDSWANAVTFLHQVQARCVCK